MRYGLLTGIASVLFSVVILMTEAEQSPVRWLELIIWIGGMVLAHNYFKQHNTGFMEYGQGLSIGTIMTAIGGLITTVFKYVYMTFVDPSYMARIMELTRTKMEEKGDISDEQIDMFISKMQKFSTGGWMLLFGVLGALLMGFIIALVVSAITKHSRPEFE
jgi:hypothetical protein